MRAMGLGGISNHPVICSDIHFMQQLTKVLKIGAKMCWKLQCWGQTLLSLEEVGCKKKRQVLS